MCGRRIAGGGPALRGRVFLVVVARPLAAACAAMAWLVPAAAMASDASASARPDVVDARVDLIMTGHISAHCVVGGGGAIDFGQLDADKQVSARFDVGCNVPFEIVFHSTLGAISHVDKPEGEGPYA